MGSRLPHGLGRCTHLGEMLRGGPERVKRGRSGGPGRDRARSLGFVLATQVNITGKNCGIKLVMGAKPLKDLVDLVGIEPTTSSMPWKRAPSCATGPRWGHYRLSVAEGLKYSR
jgi:hypothetical protein